MIPDEWRVADHELAYRPGRGFLGGAATGALFAAVFAPLYVGTVALLDDGSSLVAAFVGALALGLVFGVVIFGLAGLLLRPMIRIVTVLAYGATGAITRILADPSILYPGSSAVGDLLTFTVPVLALAAMSGAVAGLVTTVDRSPQPTR